MKVIPVVAYASAPAGGLRRSLHARFTNRLNPGNNIGVRNGALLVALPKLVLALSTTERRLGRGCGERVLEEQNCCVVV